MFYAVLMHSQVRNRRGERVTSAVTNMDIHDLSRTARTYGARALFLVTPIEHQHRLVQRILDHWGTEASAQYHPDRVEAVRLVRLAKSFDEVRERIREETGQSPEVVLTDARPIPNSVSYQDYRKMLESRLKEGNQKPVALVFGTAWGLEEEFYQNADRILQPLYGPTDYNHLSVRAAAAAIMDRLFGN